MCIRRMFDLHGIRATVFFFFNDTATTEIYTLSLHDALPIYRGRGAPASGTATRPRPRRAPRRARRRSRSEEHTSELQSRSDLVCRLLLEKKKNCRGLMAAQISGMQLSNTSPLNYGELRV